MKKLLGLFVLAVAIIAISQTGHAAPILSGVTGFAGDSLWTATVTWEVYAPWDASSHLGSTVDYHYFYYVTNTSGTSGSSLKTFTVGNTAQAVITSSGSIDRGAGTPAPDNVTVFADSIAYYFLTDIVDTGETTDWLYYTSPTHPGMVTGGLINGGKTAHEPIPGPAPEPATMAMLGLGLLGFAGAKLRKRFKA
jgi:hypothetical protein